MPEIVTLSPLAAIHLASWIEGGIQNECDAPDESVDPALELTNTINPIATKDLLSSLIICEGDEIDLIEALVQTDLPSDRTDLLAICCARAYALLRATNAYDAAERSDLSGAFHEMTSNIIGHLQLELGRQAGVCTEYGFTSKPLGEALYSGSANTRQCLEAAEIVKQVAAARNEPQETSQVNMPLKGYEISALIDAVSNMAGKDPTEQALLLKKLQGAAAMVDQPSDENEGAAS